MFEAKVEETRVVDVFLDDKHLAATCAQCRAHLRAMGANACLSLAFRMGRIAEMSQFVKGREPEFEFVVQLVEALFPEQSIGPTGAICPMGKKPGTYFMPEREPEEVDWI